MATQLLTVATSRIRPAPDNVRAELGELDELRESVRLHGILQPLLVRPVADGNGHDLEVVCGHRRLAAATQAGLEEVPAVVRDDLDDPQRVIAMLVENGQRSDLTPLEEARAFQRLVDAGVTQREVAELVSCAQSHVSKRLSLLKLPASTQKLVDSGGITIPAALDLVPLAEHPKEVERIVKSARPYGGGPVSDVDYAVTHALDEIKAKAKTAESRASLEKRGIKEVAAPRYGHFEGGKVRALGKGYGELNVGVKAHSTEPCHAAYISPRNGEVRYICTDWKRHAGDKATLKVPGLTAPVSAAADLSPDEAKRRETEKALRAAAKARLERIRTLVARAANLDAGEVMELVDAVFIERCDSDTTRIAGDVLGLDAKGKYGERGIAAEMEALARKDRASRRRVLLACALAHGEAWTKATWSSWSDARAGRHLAFLEAHGHELSPAEQAKWKGGRREASLRAKHDETAAQLRDQGASPQEFQEAYAAIEREAAAAEDEPTALLEREMRDAGVSEAGIQEALAELDEDDDQEGDDQEGAESGPGAAGDTAPSGPAERTTPPVAHLNAVRKVLEGQPNTDFALGELRSAAQGRRIPKADRVVMTAPEVAAAAEWISDNEADVECVRPRVYRLNRGDRP